MNGFDVGQISWQMLAIVGLTLVVVAMLAVIWLVRGRRNEVGFVKPTDRSTVQILDDERTAISAAADVDVAPSVLPGRDRAGRTQTFTRMRGSGAAVRDEAVGGVQSPDVEAIGRVTTGVLRQPPVLHKAWLVVERDDAESDTFAIDGRQLTRIGREPDNDVVLTSQTVHRYHAAIRKTRGDGLILVDLSGDSGNGVYVNGRRVVDAQLRDGDEIFLGTAKLTFRGTSMLSS
ncbi:MAG: FHA domain-containing protein [Pseudomonadota bacterium]